MTPDKIDLLAEKVEVYVDGKLQYSGTGEDVFFSQGDGGMLMFGGPGRDGFSSSATGDGEGIDRAWRRRGLRDRGALEQRGRRERRNARDAPTMGARHTNPPYELEFGRV